MKRDRAAFLPNWLNSKTQKPMIIRGARHVGKTWLIRDLAHSQDRQLIELNFQAIYKLPYCCISYFLTISF
jgi:predicted AAA+ superfamily ATPase